MEKETFVKMLELKTGKPFNSNPFFDVCIDDACMFVRNSNNNGVPIIQIYDSEALFQLVLKQFQSRVQSFLSLPPKDATMIFRGVVLKDFYCRKEELLSQISLLNDLSQH